MSRCWPKYKEWPPSPLKPTGWPVTCWPKSRTGPHRSRSSTNCGSCRGLEAMSLMESLRRLLRQKEREPSDGAIEAIRQSLWTDYYNDPSGAGAYLSTPEGKKDFFDHLKGRLASDRETIIPWLDDIQPLQGA